MSPGAKMEYLKKIYPHYKKATKKEKTIILDEFCQICSHHRKHAIRLFTNYKRFTNDRLLENIKVKYKTRGRATTKPGTLLKQHIPVKTEQWNENKPGFLEADTVAHCGGSLEGMYAYTVDFVDIATGWSEQRAVWGKGERGVLGQIKDVEDSLPFSILGFDSDNGSEFLNWHLFRHFTQRKTPIQFTRSRSYQKQDNCHIEQKNWTQIRQWLGYVRLDNPDVVPLMNDLYTSQWRLYHNFFCHSVKLISKKRIASRTVKRYDKPKTPYQRVLESKHIPASAKRNLKEQIKGLNPFQLRRAMKKKLKKIFAANRKNALCV
ncbi:MAG: integrase [Candidatus Omnitrophica bacterium]|nr:integrase [Candidatus Omnitrophota bacterium]